MSFDGAALEGFGGSVPPACPGGIEGYPGFQKKEGGCLMAMGRRY
jgi:hypothetical protein